MSCLVLNTANNISLGCAQVKSVRTCNPAGGSNPIWLQPSPYPLNSPMMASAFPPPEGNYLDPFGFNNTIIDPNT